MTKDPRKVRRTPLKKWRLEISALLVVMLAAGAYWFWAEGTVRPEGTARLVVDRSEIDLGALPFDAPARVMFVLTNAGDGPLTISGSPRVEAVQGC